MSFHALLAQVSACPLRPAPLADLQARVAKLADRVADPFHTLLVRVALHDTTGLRWNDWEFYPKPQVLQTSVVLGKFPDGTPVSHSLRSNPLGQASLSSFGEDTQLGSFIDFLATTSRLPASP